MHRSPFSFQTMIAATFTLSPRVVLHEPGLPPANLPDGWLALAHTRGFAFGDGSHPTTRLCAGAVDLLCRQSVPESCLDVGTGTGVLARVARARGARFVVGTDIDPNALSEASALVQLDAHPFEILISDSAPDHWGARFELVVANILEGPLRELAPALARALVPGGKLLISGFTRLQVPALRVVFTNAGLSFISQASLGDWAMLMFRREP
jgi:ribosomal protein L11 methyltransferase